MNISINLFSAILIVSSLLVACSDKNLEVEVFTLYKNVPSDPAFRVHVATFDAAGINGGGSEFYNLSNMQNCERVQQMFQTQPYSKDIKFWCEKGRFKK